MLKKQHAPRALESRLRRAFSAGLHGAGRQFGRASRVCDAVGTALLDARDLERRRCATWDDFGLGGDHIEYGLFRWEQLFYQPLLRPGSSILLVGCGSGRDLLALLELGHRVVGIDPAPRATAIARQQLAACGHPACVHTTTLEQLSVDELFDLVIFSWFTYSYILGRDARVRTLTRAEQLLAADGRVLISLPASGPPASRLLPLMRLVARLGRSDWIAEPGDFFSVLGRSSKVAFQHQFAPGELEAEARQARLRVAERREREGVEMFELCAEEVNKRGRT